MSWATRNSARRQPERSILTSYPTLISLFQRLGSKPAVHFGTVRVARQDEVTLITSGRPRANSRLWLRPRLRRCGEAAVDPSEVLIPMFSTQSFRKSVCWEVVDRSGAGSRVGRVESSRVTPALLEFGQAELARVTAPFAPRFVRRAAGRLVVRAAPSGTQAGVAEGAYEAEVVIELEGSRIETAASAAHPRRAIQRAIQDAEAQLLAWVRSEVAQARPQYIRAKNFELTEAIRSAVTTRTDRLSFDPSLTLAGGIKVVLSVENSFAQPGPDAYRARVVGRLRGDRVDQIGDETWPDLYRAIDEAFDELERALRARQGRERSLRRRRSREVPAA